MHAYRYMYHFYHFYITSTCTSVILPGTRSTSIYYKYSSSSRPTQKKQPPQATMLAAAIMASLVFGYLTHNGHAATLQDELPPQAAILQQPEGPRPPQCTVRDGNAVVTKAHELLQHGFSAGGLYPDVWIRDLNTFIETTYQATKNVSACREVLSGFLLRQHPDGEVPDGYIPGSAPRPATETFGPCLDNGVHSDTCKNTAVTDQEASLVQATAKYVRASGDYSFLRMRQRAGGSSQRSVLEGMEAALKWTLANRQDSTTGLIWGGTTMDWGDVQVEGSNIAEVCRFLNGCMHLLLFHSFMDPSRQHA